MRSTPALLLLGAAGSAPLAAGLNNGLGLTPLMGFSSWNAFSSNVSSALMRNITRILVDSGLAAKGYNHVRGWWRRRRGGYSSLAAGAVGAALNCAAPRLRRTHSRAADQH